jgi:hypothetical protein
VVYIVNAALFSHKEELNYVVCRKWMELEIIMLSKIRQIQEDKKSRFPSYVESMPYIYTYNNI